jgi:hypothetical protein
MGMLARQRWKVGLGFGGGVHCIYDTLFSLVRHDVDTWYRSGTSLIKHNQCMYWYYPEYMLSYETSKPGFCLFLATP